jgi:hypothetical protein
MPTESQTAHDRSLGIVPEPVCNHPGDVAEVSVRGPLRLFVRFHDGTCGDVDLSQRVHSPNAGVFAALADQQVFSEVFVWLGAVTWPGDIDLAPDAMYEALKRDGEWRLQ